MEPAPYIKCDRCRDRFRGRQNYCPLCGKELPQDRVTVNSLISRYLRAGLQDVFIFFRTWRDLWLRPGKVVHAHFSGDRRYYYNPVHYFLLLASAFTFLSLLGPAGKVEIPEQVKGIDFWGVPLAHYLQLQGNYFNVYIFLAVPAVAFFCWLMYLGKDYFYGEHLLANFYVMAQLLTLNMLSLLLVTIHFHSGWVQALIMLLLFLYFGWAYRSIFQQNLAISLLKAAFSYFAGAMVYGIFFFFLTILFLKQYHAITGQWLEIGG